MPSKPTCPVPFASSPVTHHTVGAVGTTPALGGTSRPRACATQEWKLSIHDSLHTAVDMRSAQSGAFERCGRKGESDAHPSGFSHCGREGESKNNRL